MDLFGPPHYESLKRSKYGFDLVDDYSRFTWTYFLRSKETQDTFKLFATRSQWQLALNILAVRSDNETEFKNVKMDEFFDNEGIFHTIFP